MRRSQLITDILTLAAVLLVGVLVLIAVVGVIVRHGIEHGHDITRPHASAPGAQGSEAGQLREANDGGGLHGFSYATGSLSDAVRRRRNGSDKRK